MYDAIRQLIRENRVADALRAMDKLDLGREHASRLTTLHRRWRILEDKAMGNLIEERLIRIEENGLVEDILQLLDHAEHPLPEAEEIAHAGAPAGAVIVDKASTTGKGNTTGGSSKRWLIAGVAAAAVLLAFWMLRPDPKPTPGATTVTERTPTETVTPPASTKTPAESTPTTQRPTVTLSEAAREKLSEAASSRLSDRTLRVDPNILANRDLIKTILPPLMTDGQMVPMTVAVYLSDKAPTKYNVALTKNLGAFLRSRLQREISIEVLTENFHDWEEREKMQLRGVADDARLKASRTPHVLMVDIRNIRNGKGEIRTCLYDVNRKKGFTRGGSIAIGTASSPKENAILEPVLKFLVELKERGLFK